MTYILWCSPNEIKSGLSKSIPGSSGFFSPRWSPDGRFVVALTARSQGLVLFDFQTGKWRVLTHSNEINFSFPSWSHDSRYVYVQGPGEGIARVDVNSGKIESVASLKNVRTTAVRFRMLGSFSLTPDDRIMILRDTGTEDIYALDLEY
jgi:Tol biopolymer transport system component